MRNLAGKSLVIIMHFAVAGPPAFCIISISYDMRSSTRTPELCRRGGRNPGPFTGEEDGKKCNQLAAHTRTPAAPMYYVHIQFGLQFGTQA